MSENKVWQDYAKILKELLALEYSPLGISLLEGLKASLQDKKVRICRGILEAAKGKLIYLDKTNNACFGAAWHLGFHKIKDPEVIAMIKKFVVEGEKLFCSYEALDNLLSQMQEPPDNSDSCFLLCPLEKCENQPQLVIFIVNAEQACRLLTFVTFFEGLMPKIKIGGPTCRLSIIYPLLTQEVNISFYDYTSRKMCNLDKDKLIVSLPYKLIPKIVENIDKCSAGRAKIEFPQEFREFLQKRMSCQKIKG